MAAVLTFLTLKGITHGGFYVYVSYHYALSPEMAQETRGFHHKCAWTLRPFDG